MPIRTVAYHDFIRAKHSIELRPVYKLKIVLYSQKEKNPDNSMSQFNRGGKTTLENIFLKLQKKQIQFLFAKIANFPKQAQNLCIAAYVKQR